MITVHLHGKLKEKFGSPYTFAAQSAAEAVRALDSQLKGFRSALREGSYQVVRGELINGIPLTVDGLKLSFGKQKELHLVPEVSGAKSGSITTIIGVAIIAAALILAPESMPWATSSVLGASMGATAFAGITYGTIAAFGLSMTLSGVSQMLSSNPKSNYGQNNSPDQRPSYLFSGQVNVSEPGGAIPVVYGQFGVGSTVISVGLAVEQIT